MEQLINILLLIWGFIFVFFAPGFLALEMFFPKIKGIEKLPFVLLLSVFISTYLVFLTSLLFGYSAVTIFFTSLPFIVSLLFSLYKKREEGFTNFKKIFKEHFWGISLSLLFLLIFFVALYPAIFTFYHGYIVMSAVNWQDTAMHQSFIESFSQGNFPPQAVYFSGHALTYYYFMDFHSSILETIYGQFFPRILVYDNPFFILIFALSVYCLSMEIFKKKSAAIFSTILASFFGNFMFLNLFSDVLNEKGTLSFWSSLIEHLTNKGYTAEFGKLMLLTPMADYFLQNRPMMIGLPSFALVNLLVIKGLRENDKKRILLAGLITGMLIKFQLFAFVCCGIVFILGLLIFSFKDITKNLKFIFIYGAPILIFVIFFSLFFNTGQSLLSEFTQNLTFGIWDKTKDLSWYLLFYLTNFGMPFLIVILMAAFYVFFIAKKYSSDKLMDFIFAEFFLLFVIPHLVGFTVYPFDMFKFFYFMVIPMSVLAGIGLSRILKYKFFGFFLITFILLISSLNSLTTLAWSYLNKYPAYSLDEYQAGLWVRQNTLPKSVFVSYPSVHSPISEIGGRLRVLSYIVWPYSHGFNRGEDNVFSRQLDIQNLYQNLGDQNILANFKAKYHADYLYLGNEEKNSYGLNNNLTSPNLRLVYNLNSIQIYQIK
jgi:hypothetical protein